MLIHEDRLLPADPETRAVARRLFDEVRELPIIAPHGHTDPRWYAEDEPFPDPAQLLIVPDHYVFRMLYSQGVKLEELGIAPLDGGPYETDGRKIWRRFAAHYHLFRGTPTRSWLDHVFATLFGIGLRLSAKTADHYYDTISEALLRQEFRPRALFERFNIGAISTTDHATDDLRWHKAIRESGWSGRVVPAYRPDQIVDPERENFLENLARFGEVAGEDIATWRGYLAAHRKRRDYFKSLGATSTDHGHASARTADLPQADAEALYERVRSGRSSTADAELFRAQMLTEMAGMSVEDGLVLQLHPGSVRNHNSYLYKRFGRDMGCDIPSPTDYVHALKPLLNRFGNDSRLTFIVFTLDETSYSRELAPLAGHYPALKLGPAWWFYDSPEGMRRFRELTTETAGFYNTAGFNDDTRAFPSIPARHDVARRVDCGYLAELVVTHRIGEDEAAEVAVDLAYGLAKKAYKL